MNVFDAKKLTPDFWNVINGYDYKRVSADEIVKEGFLGNELVYACVSSLARACASTPIKLMVKTLYKLTTLFLICSTITGTLSKERTKQCMSYL